MEKFPEEWPRDLKKTRQRACVLSVLDGAETPLCAAEIFRRLGGDAPVSLSTVYRILDLFTDAHIAVKTVLPESGTALFERDRHEHKHYAICLGCHRMIELRGCPLEEFLPELKDDGFRVLGHRLELYGYCADCQEKK